MTTLADFDAYVRAHEREYIEELNDLVRLPTVSAQKSAIDETARAVLERTRRAGVAAESLRVDGGPPTIVGEIGRGERTLLVYDHYDVQPPDPLDEWKTPPFEPTERDGHLFARGVSDNKGNLMARLQAIEAYRAIFGELPLRVRVLYEGEEEIGSEHLAEFVRRNADRLRADALGADRLRRALFRGDRGEDVGRDRHDLRRGAVVDREALLAPAAADERGEHLLP